MTRRARSRRAFTLFEVLLAIALTLSLLGAMFSFFWDILAARDRAQTESARRRAAGALIEGVERDLFTALVGDGVVGAGVAGDDESIRILMRRVPAHRAERGPVISAFGDLERSEYAFDGRGINVRRAPAGPSARGGGTPAALGGAIARVRFRYLDRGSWRDSFDSLDAGRLPEAVEVAVWYDPWPGDEDAGDATDDNDAFARSEDDFGDAFDERAFAMESDFDLRDEPWPDRVRVIVLDPTATGDEGFGASGGDR